MQQRGDPPLPVPSQGGEVVTDRVEPVAVSAHHLRVPDLLLSGDVVFLLKPVPQAGVVRVPPPLSLLPPWETAVHVDAHVELVIPQPPLELRVILHDEHHVRHRAFHSPRLRDLQLSLPALPIIPSQLIHRIHPGEVLLHAPVLLLNQRELRPPVRSCELHHLTIRFQPRHILLPAPFVEMSEQVDAHKVERIEQLPARRVGVVVRVGEPAVVADQTSGHAALTVGVPAILPRRLIHAGEESLDGILDGVSPAERAYDPLLLLRVLRLLHLTPHSLALTLRHRPLRAVPPVVVRPQHLIGIEELTLLMEEHELTVLRC